MNKWMQSLKNPEKQRTYLIGSILVLLVVLVFELVFHLYLAPSMRITKIFFLGDNVDIGDQELLNWIGYEKTPYYFSLNEQQVQEALLGHPKIKSASVSKVFPDRLELILQAREPLLVSFFHSSDGLRAMVVDDQGMVISVGPLDQKYDVPILSGLRIGQVEAGTVFPPSFHPFLQDLHRIKKEAPGAFAMIGELVLEGREEGVFDVWLVPQGYRTRALLEQRISLEKINRLLAVLDVIQAQGLGNRMGEIDFRTQEVIYGTIEG